MFAFNEVTHKAVLKPVAKTYETVVPEPPRKAVRNFFRNLREPWVFINDILQGEFKRAGTTFQRFVINSTVGIGGLLNISEGAGLEYHQEDFGQTLAVWGVGDGPYLVLPFLGPSSGRDAFGSGVGFFADPAAIAIDNADEEGLQLGKIGVESLDRYSRSYGLIDEVLRNKDPYLYMRIQYQQNRAFEIRNGKRDHSEADDIFDEIED
ncbi:hypothetical protein GCM10017044_18300 [Kordiimonas sediminis]|uniref:VacJ family lipoprotein n=2 Tax=Kordiimonas sediminis TaxID=1735581 RepID=A0A919E8N1_9PROT|nr:hypothetical protein GCM10017044_18300 [Kordiimonas sediminis]